MKGGEVDAERLVRLAAQDIADEILPQISGNARYRMRLVLNALKIAGAELRDRGGLEAIKRAQFADLRQSSSIAGQGPEESLSIVEKAIQSSLRDGLLDGDAALHRSLLIIAEARRALVE